MKSLVYFVIDGDIEGFNEYLNSDDTIYFNEPECFDTEAEALAYCAGIGYGVDEHAPETLSTPKFGGS